MRRIRGYLDAPLVAGRELVLPEQLGNHLSRVLRLRVGDRVALFNGDGREHAAELRSLQRGRVQVLIGEELPALPESPLRLHLAQALCRGEKMDLVLQKATELGVHSIQPLLSERCGVHLDADREGRRLAHWRQVVASACEQCGRARLPHVEAPRELGSWLAALPVPDADADAAEQGSELRLLLDPHQSATLRELPPPSSAWLAVGPEGGFTSQETHLLRHRGFHGLRLGPRILRTETAGLAALAAIQAWWGDW